MVCDPKDSKVMGPAYKYRACDVEGMSPEELVDCAHQQREWFFANIASKKKTIRDLDDALQAAMASTEGVLA